MITVDVSGSLIVAILVPIISVVLVIVGVLMALLMESVDRVETTFGFIFGGFIICIGIYIPLTYYHILRVVIR